MTLSLAGSVTEPLPFTKLLVGAMFVRSNYSKEMIPLVRPAGPMWPNRRNSESRKSHLGSVGPPLRFHPSLDTRVHSLQFF